MSARCLMVDFFKISAFKIAADAEPPYPPASKSHRCFVTRFVRYLPTYLPGFVRLCSNKPFFLSQCLQTNLLKDLLRGAREPSRTRPPLDSKSSTRFKVMSSAAERARRRRPSIRGGGTTE